MELKTRTTHYFLEIKVDEIETTIFKDSEEEIQSTIDNLLEVVQELYDMIDKDMYVNVCDK